MNTKPHSTLRSLGPSASLTIDRSWLLPHSTGTIMRNGHVEWVAMTDANGVPFWWVYALSRSIGIRYQNTTARGEMGYRLKAQRLPFITRYHPNSLPSIDRIIASLHHCVLELVDNSPDTKHQTGRCRAIYSVTIIISLLTAVCITARLIVMLAIFFPIRRNTYTDYKSVLV